MASGSQSGSEGGAGASQAKEHSSLRLTELAARARGGGVRSGQRACAESETRAVKPATGANRGTTTVQPRYNRGAGIRESGLVLCRAPPDPGARTGLQRRERVSSVGVDCCQLCMNVARSFELCPFERFDVSVSCFDFCDRTLCAFLCFAFGPHQRCRGRLSPLSSDLCGVWHAGRCEPLQ